MGMGVGECREKVGMCMCRCMWGLSLMLSVSVACRDVRFSLFLSEFKHGKERALELLGKLPHCIPHRQVGCTSFACTDGQFRQECVVCST